MSGNGGGRQSTAPFGYTFVGSTQAPGQSQSTSPTVAGVPLLDRNETNVLDNFFDNPNNIDPSFLAFAPGQQDQDVYNTASEQWLFSVFQQEQSPQLAHSQAQTSPMQGFGQQQGMSDDVYNAAKFLHSHQSAYGSGGNLNPQTFFDSSQPSSAQMYTYGQAPQSAYHSSSSSQTSPTGQSMYASMMPSRPMSAHQPGPLNFGSDNKFGSSKYVASSMQKPPEEDLMGILSTFSHDTGESPTQVRECSPDPTGKRKRKRASSASVYSDDETESSPQRRSRQKPKVEEDSDVNSPQSKPKRALVASHRRRSSPTGRKPARENLTEEQKRNNHIQSEQKRRNLIKLGFEETNRMVPELRAGGFSKSNMLQEAAKFMRELKEGNDKLVKTLGVLDKG